MKNLSPLTVRRLQNFRANARGWWSLWIFAALFTVTLFSELVANEKPLVVRYDGEMYAPVFWSYNETTFGGEFELEADYHDEYIRELINADGWMLWTPIKWSHNTIDYALTEDAPSAPSARHLLGTDDQARDVLARALYGFRISVLFGLALTVLSSVIGIAAGAVQGYFGGRLDIVMQRFIEIWEGLPQLYLLIIVAAFFAPSFLILLVVMLLFSWTRLVAVVRAEFLRARNFEYIRAARALGVANRVIMYRHMLPNAMVATLTFMPFILGASVTTLTALDFLGFGLPVGSPSLGELLLQGKNNLQAPWLGITGFVVISLMLSLLIFIGEATRDAFDPRKLFK